jgi:hypothetical protein
MSLMVPLPALAETPVVAVFEIQDARLEASRLERKKIRALTDLLRNFLAEGGAFKVVPQSGLRRAMKDAKKRSYQECFDEACQIEIGKAVSASKLVATKILQIGSQCIVTSTMFDLRTEATDRAEHSKGECSEEMLALSLEKVAVKLKADRAFAELEEPAPGAWDPGTKKRVIASFRSEPPGALVQIDGKLACQDSSSGCRRTLTAGKHVVSMQKERYRSRSEEVFVEDGSEIAWTLEPNFARVQIRTEPLGLSIAIDGQRSGRTPVDAELEPGEHLVELADDCHLPSERRITVLRGRSDTIELRSTPREGAIDVSAVDESGNAVRADVFVDGKHAGRAPDLIKVNVCAQKIRVASDEHGAWEGSIAIGERQTVEVEAKLSRQSTPEEPPEGGAQPSTEQPAAPPGIGLRLGAQAMVGIVCLDATGGVSSTCLDRITGYGGLLNLQYPTNHTPEAGGWYLRGSLRAGFLYYPGSISALYEVPVGLAAELGLANNALEYAVGGEALYVFRKFTRLDEASPDFEARSDASPHAFDLGLYLVVRISGFDVGGGVYIPVSGIGDSVVGRFWLGYAYDL